MSRNQWFLVVFAMLIACVALVIGIRASSSPGLASNRASIGSAIDRETVKRADRVEAEQLEPVAAAAEAAARAVPSLPEAGALADAVGATVSAYAGGLDGYVEALRGQGIEPSPAIAEDPEWAADAWKLARALFVNAVFDLNEIAVTRVGPGSAAAGNELGFGSIVSRRDIGRPFLQDLPERRRMMVECLLPGSFTAQDGMTFDGILVFQFTHNPEEKLWVLTEMRMHNVPVGVTVVLPPV